MKRSLIAPAILLPMLGVQAFAQMVVASSSLPSRHFPSPKEVAFAVKTAPLSLHSPIPVAESVAMRPIALSVSAFPESAIVRDSLTPGAVAGIALTYQPLPLDSATERDDAKPVAYFQGEAPPSPQRIASPRPQTKTTVTINGREAAHRLREKATEYRRLASQDSRLPDANQVKALARQVKQAQPNLVKAVKNGNITATYPAGAPLSDAMPNATAARANLSAETPKTLPARNARLTRQDVELIEMEAQFSMLLSLLDEKLNAPQ